MIRVIGMLLDNGSIVSSYELLVMSIYYSIN
jgi:hypothetical protein